MRKRVGSTDAGAATRTQLTAKLKRSNAKYSRLAFI